MIIAQVSITPIGEGTGVHKYVKVAIEEIKKSGVKYDVNAMSTVLEVPDLDTLFDIVKRSHNAVLKQGAKRVITEIKIDDRKDKEATIKSKLSAVKNISLAVLH